jgi:uncharacterized protein YndB with AHSA1/START domain
MSIEPVVKEITVKRDVEDAFALFTTGINEWWPLQTHSIADAEARSAVFEGEVGGRIYETTNDGTEYEWGKVTIWEPPHRVTYLWHPNPNPVASTEVEVRFSSAGDSTIVRVEHRGWERFGETAEEKRMAYQTGWDPVLECYLRAAV